MAHERIKLEEDCAILKNRIIDLAAWLKEILADPDKDKLDEFKTQYNAALYRKENKEEKGKRLNMWSRFIELSPEFTEVENIYNDLLRCFPRSSKAELEPKVLTELRNKTNPKLDLIIENAQKKIKVLNEKKEEKFTNCKKELIREAKQICDAFKPKKSHQGRKIKMTQLTDRFVKELLYDDTLALMRLQSDIGAHIASYISDKNKQNMFGYTQENFENEKPRFHYATFLRKTRDHLKKLGFLLRDHLIPDYSAEAKIEEKKASPSKS